MLTHIRLSLLLSCCLLCFCGTAPEPAGELPLFPPEKTAADFPGITYPAFEGELPAPASLNGPVWLIGIDGADWDLMEPMMQRGELPNIARLVEEGAHGPLLSEEPTISPALWATIATGMPRFRHGVVNFMVKLPGRFATVQAGPPDRRSPAVWELVGAAGGRSAVISWFGSYPAEEITGYYISKGFDPEELRPAQIHPDSMIPVLLEEGRVRLRRQDAEAIALSNFLRDTLLEDARSLAAFRTILSREPVEFAAVYLSGPDVVQHVTWRHMDPSSQQFPQDGEADPRFAGVIPAYYRFVDDAVGEIGRMAPPGTTIVVVSDHGGGPMQPEEAYHFQLEVLLERLGLMQQDRGALFAIGELYRHEKRIWLNLAAADETAGIAERLRSMTTDSGAPLFASVADHTADPGWGPDDPALTVRFSPDALVASKVIDGGRELDFAPVRLRHTDVSGAHRLEGILILHGPAVRPGPLSEAATIYNIAPTLLYLLGLPQDQRMLSLAPAGGGVLSKAMKPEIIDSHPVLMISEYPATDRALLLRSGEDSSAVPDPAAEAAVEKLRSLGYIR
jgi:predicted AlkP superfamily phosphohydrolase/phosphomutase